MLLTGINLLRIKKNDNKININHIESQLGFILPPIYKIFMESFEVGKQHEFKITVKTSNNYMDYYAEYKPLENDEKWYLCVHYLYDIEQMICDHLSYLHFEPEWQEFKFLKIANIGQGGGLFVGTYGEYTDAIFQVVWDFEEPYFKVANNIFEFIRGFELDNSITHFPNGIDLSKLYKNWGEDFWRIREE